MFMTDKRLNNIVVYSWYWPVNFTAHGDVLYFAGSINNKNTRGILLAIQQRAERPHSVRTNLSLSQFSSHTTQTCPMSSVLLWEQHWDTVFFRPQAGYYGMDVFQTDQLEW